MAGHHGAAPAPRSARLSTMLSHALVALTIEVDNEVEAHLPHRTTRGTSTTGPWLVSLPMWSLCLRFVDDDGVDVVTLQRRARITVGNLRTILSGLRRWGYVRVDGTPLGPTGPYRASAIVRPTGWGRRGRDQWQTWVPAVEARWRARFGAATVDQLQGALAEVRSSAGPSLPDYLPLQRYGMWTEVPNDVAPPAPGADPSPPLVHALARTLLALTLDVEHRCRLAMPVVVNVLGALEDGPVPVSALPAVTGISREAVAIAQKHLETTGDVRTDGGSRARTLGLTATGGQALVETRGAIDAVVGDWRQRHGDAAVDRLTGALTGITVEQASALVDALVPPDGGWRGGGPRRLPDHPVVSHRGGYPDGA